MKNYIVCLSIVLIGCTALEDENSGQQISSQDKSFDNFKSDFMEAWWQVHPGWATHVGYHKYDSVLVVPSDDSRKNEITFNNNYLDSLKSFDMDSLSAYNKTDYLMIRDALNSALWYIEEYRGHEWKPSSYNIAGSFEGIINSKYAPLEDRLRNIYLKMANVPAYYESAKATIANPTLEHTELAITQNRGGVYVFDQMIRDSINAANMGEHERQMMMVQLDTTIAAINNYVNWLENDLAPSLDSNSARTFRLGKDLYYDKVEFDLAAASGADDIYQKAIQHKKMLHKKMYEITATLWPDYFDGDAPPDTLVAIRNMIDTLSYKHVHRDSFIAAIEQQLPELVRFVINNELMYLDPSKPLVVRETPLFMRGTGAGASVSAPGPYDSYANTYYNVTPLDRYSDEEAESYLREYNYYILQILNIHEAIPGHYTQLVYSNTSPSLIKSVFGNGTMIEGWAVYTERMMLESGYGEDDPAMWLMYYKWNLRTVCNTILDYGVHVLGMTEQEAKDLLINEAFQQDAEASGKWRRVKLTSVQLYSYFTGYTEIYDLRDEMKEQLGSDFNLKEFHEKFLSYGSAPVKYIRELMLK